MFAIAIGGVFLHFGASKNCAGVFATTFVPAFEPKPAFKLASKLILRNIIHIGLLFENHFFSTLFQEIVFENTIPIIFLLYLFSHENCFLANLETSFWGFLKNGNFQKNSVKISFKIFRLNWLHKECFEKLFLK